jgi:hypothetical protein
MARLDLVERSKSKSTEKLGSLPFLRVRIREILAEVSVALERFTRLTFQRNSSIGLASAVFLSGNGPNGRPYAQIRFPESRELGDHVDEINYGQDQLLKVGQ